MKIFVFLVILATAVLKDVQSYPVDAAADVVVPVKVEAKNGAQIKSEKDTLETAKADTEPVAPVIAEIEASKPKTEPVVSTKSDDEPVVPTKSEAEPVVPTKSEAEPVVPTKSEAEPLVPTKSEAEPVAPSKSVDEPVEPSKSVDKPVVPAKSETDAVEPATSDVKPVVPPTSGAEPESPAKLKVKPVDPAKTETVQAVDVPVVPEVNFIVPDIPKSFKNSGYGSSSFGNIWSNRLFQFPKAGGILRDSAERSAVPVTILAPTEILVVNLVPQDAPHPLYSSDYTTLTETFILDFLSSDKIDPEDAKLLTPDGVIIKTRTGKDLVFKRDSKTNVVTVNGIVVTKFNKLPGDPEVTVVDIDGIPFDYSNIIDTAFQELSKKSEPYGLAASPPKVATVESGVVDEPVLSAEVKPKGEGPSVKP